MSDEIFRALGRIEGTLKAVQDDTNEIKGHIKEHNHRIGSLEGFKIQVLAIAGLVGTATSLLWDLIKQKFGA